MNLQTHPPGLEDSRRFYMWLPLITLPFLTAIYYVLVVKSISLSPGPAAPREGLLTTLPDAFLKQTSPESKLDYYRKAQRDSVLRAQQLKKDPYLSSTITAGADSTASALRGLDAPRPPKKAPAQRTPHSDEHKVKKSLDALQKAISVPQQPALEPPPQIWPNRAPSELDHLEAMMSQAQDQAMQQQPDPELEKLDGMLDKILQIQDSSSPQTQPQRTSRLPALHTSYPVESEPVGVLTASGSQTADLAVEQVPESGFFSLQAAAQEPQMQLTAVIESDQKLVTGSLVRLRLTSELAAGQTVVPENTMLFGLSTLAGERLLIHISSIQHHGQLLPVDLHVFDVDGQKGIYIPGSLPRTVIKQAAGQNLQSLDLDIATNSLGTQVADASIQMAKGFFARKTRLVQVSLSEGYQVILKDNQSNLP